MPFISNRYLITPVLTINLLCHRYLLFFSLYATIIVKEGDTDGLFSNVSTV